MVDELKKSKLPVIKYINHEKVKTYKNHILIC